MAKAKAWDYGVKPFPTDYEVIDKMMLQCTDLSNNNNKFYSIEFHKSGNQFRIFTEYGRTGITGKKEERFYDLEYVARNDYDTIIKEKKKKGYAPVDVAQSTKGSDKAKMITKISIDSIPMIQTSKLHTETQSLVRQIYEESGNKINSMMNTSAIGSSASAPLGTLTIDQINMGHKKISEIRKYLNDQPNDNVVQLSSEYFKTIPRRLPMKVDKYFSIYTIEKADEEEELLNLLKDSLQVQKGFGAGIDVQYDQIGADIEYLPQSDSEWSRIAKKIATTQDPGHNHTVNINRIFKIKTNTELKFRNDLHNLQELYHGSRSANIVGILKNSLRIRPAGAITAGTMFGPGIYFADQVTKSTNYSLGSWGGSSNKNSNAFVFLADVSLGNVKKESNAAYWTKNTLPREYHSVMGMKGYSLRNNEFIVYTPEQVQLRYLVDFTPKYGRGW